MRLISLAEGEESTVSSIEGDSALKDSLYGRGIAVGERIGVFSRSANGIIVAAGGLRFALDFDTASKIYV